MTVKSSEILNKLMGAGMIIASVSFFSYIPTDAPYIIPGLLFGGAGFWLAARRDRHAAAELQLQQRVEQLAEGLAATQLELTAAQERLDRLSDERDFMRQLATPVAQPQRPAGPLPPTAEQPRLPDVTPPPRV